MTVVPPISMEPPVVAMGSYSPPGRFASTKHSVTGGLSRFTSAIDVEASRDVKSKVWKRLSLLVKPPGSESNGTLKDGGVIFMKRALTWVIRAGSSSLKLVEVTSLAMVERLKVRGRSG